MDSTISSLKILVPDPALYTSQPTIQSYLSFAPYYQYLKKRISDPDEQIADFLQNIVDRLEKNPMLLQPIKRSDLQVEHTKLFELIAATLFPFSKHKDLQYYALSSPFRYEIFFYSKSYSFYFKPDDHGYVQFPPERPFKDMEKEHELMAYRSILSRFYQVEIRGADHRTNRYLERTTGLQRYSRLQLDESFLEVKLLGDLPEIPEGVINRGAGIINDMDTLKSVLPLTLFRFEGFLVRRSLVDVTVEQCISEVRYAVMDMRMGGTTGGYEKLKTAVETLAEINPVEVSLVPFLKVNDKYVYSEPYAGKSMLLRGLETDAERTIAYSRIAAILNDRHKPVFLHGKKPKVKASENDEYLEILKGHYKGSFIISPHFDHEGLIGMVEIHAPEAEELAPEILGRLEPVFSYFELAFRNNISQFRDSVDSLVKEEFTSLQEVVEWKFRDVAWQHLKNQEVGNDLEMGAVQFDHIYPLYGAVDVRNSSVLRNECTRRDLSEHLLMILEMVEEIEQDTSLNLSDELKSIKEKNLAFLEDLKKDFRSEDEIRLNEYLEREVSSLFNHLTHTAGEAQELGLRYQESVNPESGHLYANRRMFDQSIGMVNSAIEAQLLREQEKIQKVFPHYFEKLRTDGIEHDIYIGHTITPKLAFDYKHLKSLRLWQLSNMAETARLTFAMQPSTPMPLMTTQLILIYGNPIAICFRTDEKRFDMDGGTHIRYEIIKKRIDKAVVRGTGERLTQPGKVAVVFSKARDIAEYEEYIHNLIGKGVLEDEVERIELADMQGVSGLKALRVTVKEAR